VSLANLLSIQPSAHSPDDERVSYPRMLVVDHPSGAWVFAVDEVDGVRRVGRRHLHPHAIGSSQNAGFVRGIVRPEQNGAEGREANSALRRWEGKEIVYLDERAVFEAICRQAFPDALALAGVG
jgi:chemotaxis signal transduction protein